MYVLCVTRDFSNANKLEVSFITFLLPKYEHEKLFWKFLLGRVPNWCIRWCMSLTCHGTWKKWHTSNSDDPC